MNIALCDDEPVQMGDIERYIQHRDPKAQIDVFFMHVMSLQLPVVANTV